MDSMVTIQVSIDPTSIEQKVDNLIDDKLMLAVHNLLAKMCDEYVPMDTGLLASGRNVTPEYVQYLGPYAHYVYVGEVYGPNIPIFKDGVFQGFKSQPGKGTKYPKGTDIKFNQDWIDDGQGGVMPIPRGDALHPKATKEWDKAMMAEKRDEFIEQVKNLLIWRAKELYG